MKDEEKVIQHAQSCEALKDLYPPDDLLRAFKFYVKNENAIIHRIDEHKVYQFFRQQQRGYFMLDKALPAYRAELWKLKDRNHEEKEEYEKLKKIKEKKKKKTMRKTKKLRKIKILKTN